MKVRTVEYKSIEIELQPDEHFIATDENGDVYAYTDKPQYNHVTLEWEEPVGSNYRLLFNIDDLGIARSLSERSRVVYP